MNERTETMNETLKRLEAQMEAQKQRYIDDARAHDARHDAIEAYGKRSQALGVEQALFYVRMALAEEREAR